jgi:hypothetical protein
MFYRRLSAIAHGSRQPQIVSKLRRRQPRQMEKILAKIK